jgi:hypothetical protein
MNATRTSLILRTGRFLTHIALREAKFVLESYVCFPLFPFDGWRMIGFGKKGEGELSNCHFGRMQYAFLLTWLTFWDDDGL